MWHSLGKAVKDRWGDRSRQMAVQHNLDHPDYRYQPRRPSEIKRRGVKRKANVAGDTAGQNGFSSGANVVDNLDGSSDAADHPGVHARFSITVGTQGDNPTPGADLSAQPFQLGALAGWDDSQIGEVADYNTAAADDDGYDDDTEKLNAEPNYDVESEPPLPDDPWAEPENSSSTGLNRLFESYYQLGESFYRNKNGA